MTRKLLYPYLTGGVRADWIDLLLAYQDGGADAIEIGLPFSDPVMDGAVIQAASDRALARGVTVDTILADLTAGKTRIRVPLYAMTYANLVFRRGAEDFCTALTAAGISGLIVPDLPVDEADEVAGAAERAGLDLVPLVATVTGDERLRRIAGRGTGFVYAVSVLGTTGVRDALDPAAARLVARVRALTDRPVLIGFGISGPDQAAEAGRAADGVVVGAALMRRVLDGATPADLRDEVAALRAALDTPEDSAEHRAHAEVPGHRR